MTEIEQARDIIGGASEDTITSFVTFLEENPEAFQALAACLDVGNQPPPQVTDPSHATPPSQAASSSLPSSNSLEAARRFQSRAEEPRRNSIPRRPVPSHRSEPASPGLAPSMRSDAHLMGAHMEPLTLSNSHHVWDFDRPTRHASEAAEATSTMEQRSSASAQIEGTPWLRELSHLFEDGDEQERSSEARPIGLPTAHSDMINPANSLPRSAHPHRSAHVARSSCSALESLFSSSASPVASTSAAQYSRLAPSAEVYRGGMSSSTASSLGLGGATPPLAARSPASGNDSINRKRRRYNEVERIFKCTYPGCVKAYASVSHLNTHRRRLGHGPPVRKVDLLETPGAIQHWPEPETCHSPTSTYTTLNYCFGNEHSPGPSSSSMSNDVGMSSLSMAAAASSYEGFEAHGPHPRSQRQQQISRLLELLLTNEGGDNPSITDEGLDHVSLALSSALGNESC